MPSLFASSLPPRHLLVLVVLVLCAHGLLLSGSNRVWSLGQRSSAAMTVRSIVAEPAPAPPPAPTQAVATSLDVPRTALAVKPPRTQKTLTKTANFQKNRPVGPINSAQTAIENVAVLLSPEEKMPATVAPELAPTLPDTEKLAEKTTPAPLPTPAPLALPEASSGSAAQREALPALVASASASSDVPHRELAFKFPPSGRFDYVATLQRGVQPQSGSGSLEWTSDGRAYEMRLSSSAFFVTLLSQTSVGQLGADGLLPERFADKRVNRSEKATHFARDTTTGAGRITFSGNQSAIPLQRGAQDRLSVLVQLAGLAAADPAMFAASGKVAIQVASTEGTDIWQWVIEGEESLQLPAGTTRALLVVRNPRQEYDARLELWLAPALGYLPVRIKQTEANGNTSDLQLRSPALKPGPTP